MKVRLGRFGGIAWGVVLRSDIIRVWRFYGLVVFETMWGVVIRSARKLVP